MTLTRAKEVNYVARRTEASRSRNISEIAMSRGGRKERKNEGEKDGNAPSAVERTSEREREALPEFDRISGAEGACPSVRVRPPGGSAEFNDFETASCLPPP